MNIQTQRGFTTATSPLISDMTQAAMRLTGGNRADTADLMQETLIKAWANRHRFEPSSFRAWMFTILRNEWCSICRYRSVRIKHQDRLMAEAPDSSEPDYDETLDLRNSAARRVLESLSPERREVVIAIEFRGMSYRETADALGVKIGTVMSRLHRARKQMAAAR